MHKPIPKKDALESGATVDELIDIVTASKYARATKDARLDREEAGIAEVAESDGRTHSSFYSKYESSDQASSDFSADWKFVSKKEKFRRAGKPLK